MLDQVRSDPLWYKDAVIYQLHVKSFFDANNDGIGDFRGLLEKLDYIRDLGVNTVWLLPFYPSPRRDDGYDIAEYRSVSPDYGTMEDLRRFVEEAHGRGLRVITELVINHTSNEHCWFQAARRAPPGSPERDFYVWSQDDQVYAGTRIIFCDTERSNWAWDEEAGAYYWHRFYSHQPDLNFDNPRVLEEVLSVMHFWLDLGIDGLRLDAIPYLIEREGTSNENLPETHAVLKKIRADLDAHYPDRMLLAEANMWPEDTQQYFGDTDEHGWGDECQMAFHFPLMPRMYMAVAQEDRFPITDIMRQTPEIPENCQWAIFLRNHDELTLEMVTDAERDYLWNTYASDHRARINLGIRRRLAPLMDRDRRRIELMNALLLSMPGTPIIYYGDEIGMGDNIHLGDRDGVRTPMQWSPDRNGGFSRADPAGLTLPVIMDPLYGYEAVNVEAQQRDSHSLLNWLRRMLVVRGEHSAFGRGSLQFLRPANRKVLAYVRHHEGRSILCVANLARTAQAVELDLEAFSGRTPVEMTGKTVFPAIGQLPYLLTLPPYGFYWFLLSEEVEAPQWSSAAPPSEIEQHTFVLRHGELAAVAREANRQILEREILPDYIAQRRWFVGKGETLKGVRIVGTEPLPHVPDLVFTEIEVTTDDASSTYSLPLGVAWEGETSGPFAPNLAIARVRRGRHVGLLTDGFAVPAFAQSIIAGLRAGDSIVAETGTIHFHLLQDPCLPDALEPEWMAAEQSNSTLILNHQVVMKLLRRIQPGVHPEAEMTRYLGERGFSNVPPLLGEVVRIDHRGVPHALLLLQPFVYNQGDGWDWTLNFLSRVASEQGADGVDFQNYRNFAELVGTRLAEMHAILAQPSDDPAFAPEPLGSEGATALGERVVREFEAALEVLGRAGPAADQERGAIESLRARHERLAWEIRATAAEGAGALRTRIHGDLHLGQILVTGNDAMFIDFEGEPARPLAERRAKDVPLRDVAGVLRSFDYAAAAASCNNAPGTEAALGETDEMFGAFREVAEQAFLEGYGAACGLADNPLLGLFLVEKAAYEVRYEASSRPDWIGIALRGLLHATSALERGDRR